MTSRENKPVFIALEGGEGAGKSTQAQLLVTRLQQEGRPALLSHALSQSWKSATGVKITVSATLSQGPWWVDAGKMGLPSVVCYWLVQLETVTRVRALVQNLDGAQGDEVDNHLALGGIGNGVLDQPNPIPHRSHTR